MAYEKFYAKNTEGDLGYHEIQYYAVTREVSSAHTNVNLPFYYNNTNPLISLKNANNRWEKSWSLGGHGYYCPNNYTLIQKYTEFIPSSYDTISAPDYTTLYIPYEAIADGHLAVYSSCIVNSSSGPTYSNLVKNWIIGDNRRVMLLLQAGGGGGGGSLAGSPAAGGGGPGGCATIMLDLNVPNIISNYAGGTGSYFPSNIVASKCCFRITLGTGGAGGGANSNGSTGGASYIELCYWLAGYSSLQTASNTNTPYFVKAFGGGGGTVGGNSAAGSPGSAGTVSTGIGEDVVFWKVPTHYTTSYSSNNNGNTSYGTTGTIGTWNGSRNTTYFRVYASASTTSGSASYPLPTYRSFTNSWGSNGAQGATAGGIAMLGGTSGTGGTDGSQASCCGGAGTNGCGGGGARYYFFGSSGGTGGAGLVGFWVPGDSTVTTLLAPTWYNDEEDGDTSCDVNITNPNSVTVDVYIAGAYKYTLSSGNSKWITVSDWDTDYACYLEPTSGVSGYSRSPTVYVNAGSDPSGGGGGGGDTSTA